MDTLILPAVSIGICLFLCIQIIGFRMVRATQRVFVISWAFAVGLMSSLIVEPNLFTGFLYIILSYLYVQCIYSPIEASITLRILTEIAHSGESGVTLQQLYTQYGREVIIKKRLERLVESKTLRIDKGIYYRHNHMTVFTFREYITRIYMMIFPK